MADNPIRFNFIDFLKLGFLHRLFRPKADAIPPDDDDEQPQAPITTNEDGLIIEGDESGRDADDERTDSTYDSDVSGGVLDDYDSDESYGIAGNNYIIACCACSPMVHCLRCLFYAFWNMLVAMWACVTRRCCAFWNMFVRAWVWFKQKCLEFHAGYKRVVDAVADFYMDWANLDRGQDDHPA
ncbi:Protein of unknown function [Pyronema omphalodes CBS 100304]|uniref:Uncharacterized protein n=1 Tax=Pyronema omphalodes (strain CBS 100304) TaxID=1076935 RepID=U4L1I1_PYROM|nr:Protein of unknown function [Pyronema omphalodes CBS 100304]